jgi:uncharacterized protein (DUF983 family)
MTAPRSQLLRTALGRGLRRRCPHCGEGRLFKGLSLQNRCAVCGLVFVRRPGDTWAFTIFFNRLPVGLMIALIYFGAVRTYPTLGVVMLIAVAAAAVWTYPNRQGMAVAVHYVSRVTSPDPDDPMPPLHR